MSDERVSIPRGRTSAPAPEEVDLARVLKALQTIDANEADRMKELKLFLFFLPFIWGVVWGVIYFVFLVATGK